MDRKQASEFDQELLDLYDEFVHGQVNRREFLERISKYALAGVTATALLESLLPRYALARQIDPDDPGIKTMYVTYASPDGHGSVRGYLTRPAQADGKLSSIVVVHENRGLNPYIEDVARRVAVADFIGLAPDGLTSVGGYPGNDDDGRKLQSQLDRTKLLEDFVAAYRYLDAHRDSTGKVGVVGFCYGGGITNAMAVRLPTLAAAVPFYGSQPASEDVARIQAPLLLHYAGLDKRINAGWPAYEAALKKHGKEYVAHIYSGVNHGFHNDTTPRYDEASARLAWDRTIRFFNDKLA